MCVRNSVKAAESNVVFEWNSSSSAQGYYIQKLKDGPVFHGWPSYLSELQAFGIWCVSSSGLAPDLVHYVVDDFGTLQPEPWCSYGYLVDAVTAASNYELS